MKITKKDVEYAAGLAMLELSPEEEETYTAQLEGILGYIQKLDKLDTSNTPPTSHILGQKNVFREDKSIPCSAQTSEQLMANAPERDDNFFRVKKVIE